MKKIDGKGKHSETGLDNSVLEDDFREDDGEQISIEKSVGGTSPVVKSWASYGNFKLVGNGSQTNDNCGKFSSLQGCLNVHSHDVIASDGKNHKGEVYIKKVYFSCGKPCCPICYHSWAVREARSAEIRLAEASKHFGQVEHTVCSVPVRDYGLELKALRAKAVKVLALRGIVGGVLIWHPFRYNSPKEARSKGVLMGWYWSPHWHILGFILGGYAQCRNCKRKNNCLKGCGGFDDRSYQAFLKDGWFVKVLGKRKTVFGTAWYQMHHSGYDVTRKRFHVATWFGVCSYRKLKVTPELRKRVCPICEHDLVKVRYNGNRFIMDENLFNGKREFFAKAVDECGIPVWVADSGGGYYG